MRRIYSAQNIAMVELLKTVLREHGIDSEIRNEFLGAGQGQLPPIECWPDLWVEDDRANEASGIVSKALAPEERVAESWSCPRCREVVDGNFWECWNCGGVRPEEPPR